MNFEGVEDTTWTLAVVNMIEELEFNATALVYRKLTLARLCIWSWCTWLWHSWVGNSHQRSNYTCPLI